MASIFWLIVTGYLLVGLIHLGGTGFYTERQGIAGILTVFFTALSVGLGWPLHLLKRTAG
jgi:hypothetical protein